MGGHKHWMYMNSGKKNEIYSKVDKPMNANTGIIYCPYIPKTLILTEEEAHALMLKERANKTFAKVKRENENPHYRCKRGQVFGTKIVGGIAHYMLHIEVLNYTNARGMMTLMGASSKYYRNIWFREDELKDFVSYDGNGNEVK